VADSRVVSKLLNESRSGRVTFLAPAFVGNKLGKYFLDAAGWSDVTSKAELLGRDGLI
jgi:hypothetical protein